MVTVNGNELVGTVNQSGTNLSVAVEHNCLRYSRPIYERTTTVKNYNKHPAATITNFAWVGAAAAGGVGCAVTDNQEGIGVLGVLAAPFLITGIVQLVRGSGAEETKVEDPREALVTAERCEGPDAPYARAVVAVKQEGTIDKVVGNTNSAGKLVVDLDTALDQSIIPDPARPILVLVEGQDIGSIESRPLYDKREERDWQALRPKDCLEPTRSSGCAGYVAFLRIFSAGRHAAEAQSIVDRGSVGTRRIAMEEDWQRTDLDACSKGTKDQTSSDVKTACLAVKRFADAAGPHQHEASTHLEKGKTRIAALEAAEAQRRAAEERAEAQRRAAEERAEAQRKKNLQKECDDAMRYYNNWCNEKCRDSCFYAFGSGDDRRARCIRDQCSRGAIRTNAYQYSGGKKCYSYKCLYDRSERNFECHNNRECYISNL